MIQSNQVKQLMNRSNPERFVELYEVEQFKNIHTKVLIKLLRILDSHTYRLGDAMNEGRIDMYEEEFRARVKPIDRWSDGIRKILSTREHVLNKPEAKLKRQLAAKKKR